MFKPTTLFSKLALAFAGFTLVLSLAITGVQTSSMYTAMRAEGQARLSLLKATTIKDFQALFDTLHWQATDAIATFRFDDFDRTAKDLIAAHDTLAYLTLSPPNGPPVIQQFLPDIDLSQVPFDYHGEWQTPLHTFYQFKAHIQSDSRHYGTLVAGFTLDDYIQERTRSEAHLRDTIVRLMIKNSLITCLLIVMGLGIIVWLSKRITQPILTLATHADQLSRGTLHLDHFKKMDDGDEVHQLNNAFLEMATQMNDAQSENDDLNRLAYVLSHDLKSPLVSIKTLSNWILRRDKDNLSSKGIEELQLIRSNISMLQEFISGVLAYFKFGQYRAVPDVISVNTVISDTLQLLRVPEGISIDIQENFPDVLYDKTLLKHIFLNLLSNAFRHTPVPGTIVISGHQEKDCMIISVQDSGVGIAPEHLDKVFQLFYRGQDKASDKRRSGVGLSIVASILDRNNGKIWVESALGKGSTFYFTLPMDSRQDH